MKIVHICFSNSYNDGWGYQDNLLPEYLAKHNIKNYVIASKNHFPDYMKQNEINQIKDKGDNYNIGLVNIRRIKTTRLTSTSYMPHGLCQLLDEIKPDMIFHHNICVGSMYVAAQYAKKNNIPFFVDNHADELNMRNSRLWIMLYHKFLLKTICHICDKSVSKYYGVTNSRCEFINKYYSIPKEKIELLPIGADTDFADKIADRDLLRTKYNLSKNDIIIVSGGKMGIRKGTDKLIQVISSLSKQYTNLRLILFGKYEDTYTEELAVSSDVVLNFSWCDRLKTLELLKLADVACWPIHHTTLIEDAISVETPLLIRKTSTTQHLIDGNGKWIYYLDENELKDTLSKLITDNQFTSFRDKCKMMKVKISYKTISEKLISDTIDVLQSKNSFNHITSTKN